MTTGVEISRRFFEQAVRPIVEDTPAGSGFLAGRLGSGSDVLGFDDKTSTDHDFGCRLTVLVDDRNASLLTNLGQELSARLPSELDGQPIRFPTSWDDEVTHNVEVRTVNDFVRSRLGFDLRTPLEVPEWLSLTGQSVLEVVAGPVFHDSTESFHAVRRALNWYPDDVWYYVLASGWTRLEQELPFVGRAGQVGDEAGSRIIASRLCRDLTHLSFLSARTWAPYPKWSGTALLRLPNGAEMADRLMAVQTAADWEDRQCNLVDAIQVLAEMHRLAGLEIDGPVITPFYDRPFVLTADHIPRSLRERISNRSTRDLPLVGSIEQWSDNVNLLTTPELRVRAIQIYGLD